MKPGWKSNALRIFAILFVIVLSVYLFTMRNRVQELEGYGYPGIFFVSFLSNATLILPVPGIVITSAMGAVFHPFWVAVAAGSGASLGEFSGYLAGFSGQSVVERTAIYDRMEGWMRKYGEWAILFLAFIPNPFFDMAGIIAGVMRMPVKQFLIWTFLGKLLKMLVFAYGGATLARFFPF